jgi:hypothetical protein
MIGVFGSNSGVFWEDLNFFRVFMNFLASICCGLKGFDF